MLPPPDPEKDREAGQRQKDKNSYASGEMKRACDPSKVIFLDVDGVLRPVNKAYCVNTITIEGISIPVAGQEGSDFSRAAMSALRHIREQTGAVLVLSSEWYVFSAVGSRCSARAPP